MPPHISGKSCTRPPTEYDLGEISLETWQVSSSGSFRLIISVVLSCVASHVPVATMRRSERVNSKMLTYYLGTYVFFIKVHNRQYLLWNVNIITFSSCNICPFTRFYQ